MTTRHNHLAAAGVTLAVFVLYLVTLSPGVAMWDAGEYIAAAASLGIPHQPGNPMFVLIAHAAGLLPLSDIYAVRINVLAALSGAVVAGLWFLCGERLLRAVVPTKWLRFVAAGAGAVLGATAFTVWNQSVVMEKVYPLALVGLALVSWLMLLWLDAEDERKADRRLVLLAYVCGLTYAIHPAGLLPVPAIALAALRHRPALIRRWKLVAVLGAAFLGGTTPFAMLAIRAAHQPYVNVSAVSACEDGSIAAACTFSAETARRLKGTIEREQYGGNAVLQRRGPISAQIGMFWLYFKWQWIRDVARSSPTTQTALAATMLLLGVFGVVALRGAPAGDAGRRRGAASLPDEHHPAFAWYFGVLAVTFTIALIYYLNFRYGFSQRPDLGSLVDREPRDRDYFYMWTFSLWGLLVAIGLASLLRTFRREIAAVALAGVAVIPLAANWSAASRTGEQFTQAWARDILMSLEPNAIIITNGDNDSFPLWYAQAVEHLRPDVTVALTPYLDMPWYARQLNQRDSLWNLSDEQLDTIPYLYEARQPMQFQHGAITASIPPGIMTRAQLLVLQAIKDSFPARPVYFSVGGYGRDLGLEPYIKRVGLVEKLESRAVAEDGDTIPTSTGFVDVPRSLELWQKYAGARQVVREGEWIDGGSSQIPLYYAFVGQELAIALDSMGRRAEAAEVLQLAREVAATVLSTRATGVGPTE
ncbi:MAG: glycosyltransferase family 117 protein [Gemmatimonadaceae bacterium]